MSFTIFQNGKSPFLAIKTSSSNTRKIFIFPKGLTLGFGAKMPIFPTFFFQGIYARKMSFTILQNKKQPILGYKNMKFKNSKNGYFSNGVNPWFWSNYGHFSIFFSCNKDQENVFYDILERKIAFLGYQKKKFKKRKN